MNWFRFTLYKAETAEKEPAWRNRLMDRIAVLIPCFNEEKTISKVVQDFRLALPEAHIYVYDNNSTDGTPEAAKAAGADVKHCFQQGKGNVIRKMFREIDAECYIMSDGDDTYPAEAAREMVRQVLEREADMVVGDRLSSTYFEENKRLFHNFGNTFVRRCVNHLFHTDIRDIMTGYRAFSFEFVKTFPVLSEGFEIETEMSIHAADKNLYVENTIIEYRDRPQGSVSKLNTYSDGIRVIHTILHLFRVYRPMDFFGILGVFLVILGALFMIPVFSAYVNTGLVDRMPTLIVCGFTILAGIISFFTGMILQNGTSKNRQDFEMQMHRARERKLWLLKQNDPVTPAGTTT